jgi:aminoglycoside phosphotransferase (APT) family kinase protein
VTAQAKDPSAAAARKARTMVAAIVEHHLDMPPRRVVAASGGLTNHVFAVDHAAGPLIVRINESAEKINDFLKEQWAIARAGAAGVPVPEVLEVGMQAVPHPYMIARRVRGENANVHRHRRTVLQQMGHLGALINSIATDGYGQTFDWSHNRLSRNASWCEFLEREVSIDARLQALQRHRMLSAAQARQLRAALLAVPPSSLKPRLNHGDMRPKNVLADERGRVTAIIDWEDCCSNPPLWDLSLALHDLSIDEKRAYAEAYGIEERELLAIAPAVRALNVLNYAPAVEQADAEGNQAELTHLRLRLNGVFDLYWPPAAAAAARRRPAASGAAGAKRAGSRKLAVSPAGAAASPASRSAPARASARSRPGSPRSRPPSSP